MKEKIKNIISDVIGNIQYYRLHSMEIRKFKDKRRIEIANTFLLNKEQKEQIDQLFLTNYGEKVDYVWQQNYAAHAGRFDCRLFPEVLYTPEFEAFQNQNHAAVRMMSDKNFLPLIAKATGVKMPRTIVSCTNGLLRDDDNHIISEKAANELLKSQGSFFVKPSVDSCSGQGCMKVDDGMQCQIIGDKMTVADESGGGTFTTMLYKNSSHVMTPSECYIHAA